MAVQIPKVTQSHQPEIMFLDPLTDFYERLLPLETVEALYADWRPDGLEVWLVVNRVTETNRKQIYAQELAVMQAFPGLGLDTRLIDRTEIDPGEVVDLTTVDAFLRFPRLAYA
jgi:hypothetical protein